MKRIKRMLPSLDTHACGPTDDLSRGPKQGEGRSPNMLIAVYDGDGSTAILLGPDGDDLNDRMTVSGGGHVALTYAAANTKRRRRANRVKARGTRRRGR